MGIFGGIKDMFTGGGGQPGFEGMNKTQRNQMMAYQLHNQQRATDRMNQNDLATDYRYQLQQATLPYLFQQMGINPQYDSSGKITGYNANQWGGEDGAQFYGDGQEWQARAGTSDGGYGGGGGVVARPQGDEFMQYSMATAPGISQAGGQLSLQQARNDAAMTPWTMQNAGYTPQYDEAGNLTGITGDDRFQQQYTDQGNEFNRNMNDQLGGMEASRQYLNQGMEGDLGRLETSRQYSVGSFDPALQAAQRNMTFEEGQINPQLQRLGMQYGGNGQYVNDPNSPEARSRSMQALFLNRANDAMAGKTQQDPTLVRQLQQEEQALRNQLAASLGPDYATSTPGMAALADFSKRRAEAYYGDTQNQMNQGVQNANSLGQYGLSTMDRLFGVGKGMRDSTNAYGNLAQARAGTDLSYQGLQQQGRNSQANMNLGFGNAALAGRQAQGQGNLNYMNAGNAVRQQNIGNIFGASGNARASQQAMQPWAQMAEDRPLKQQMYRSQRMNDLYTGLNFATRDPGYLNSAALAGQLGSQSPALPWATADWEGDIGRHNTNINNIWWQNFMKSAGSSTGKAAGSMAGGAI